MVWSSRAALRATTPTRIAMTRPTLALLSAVAPLTLGILWSREAGYTHGLWLLLVLAMAAVAALWIAQRLALRVTD